MSWYHEHWNIGPVTIYGENAMAWAWNIKTRWGYICFRPSTFRIRHHSCDLPRIWWRRWYFYFSRNATPWAATFAIGPGVDRDDKEKAKARRLGLGEEKP